MRYKLLGPTGLRVSELALGTMTFGDDWGWGASEEESRRIFDRFAEAGGNFIDTANNYTNGTSERLVGRFVAADRDHFVVATKYALTEREDDPNFGGNHRKNLLRSINGSLRRLSTDYVDVLWLHMWDGSTSLEEVLRAMDDLVRAGKVLSVGFSDTPAWVVARAVAIADLRGWIQPSAIQLPYNLAMTEAFTRATQRVGADLVTLVEAARRLGIYVMASASVHQGQLTRNLPPVVAEFLPGLETDTQRALQFVRSTPGIGTALIGMKSTDHVEENALVTGVSPLAAGDFARLFTPA